MKAFSPGMQTMQHYNEQSPKKLEEMNSKLRQLELHIGILRKMQGKEDGLDEAVDYACGLMRGEMLRLDREILMLEKIMRVIFKA
jgi:hypothetical protein